SSRNLSTWSRSVFTPHMIAEFLLTSSCSTSSISISRNSRSRKQGGVDHDEAADPRADEDPDRRARGDPPRKPAPPRDAPHAAHELSRYSGQKPSSVSTSPSGSSI